MKIRALIIFMFCLILFKGPIYAVTAEASTEEVRAIVIETLDYMDVEAYPDATDILTRAINKAPNMAELYILRSECYLQQGEFKRSYDDALKAHEIAPKWAIANHACAVCYYFDDTETEYYKYKTIVAIEKNAIDLDPSLADAYAFRAYSNYKLKEYGNAWNDVKKLREMGVELDPTFMYMLNKDSGGEPKMFFFF